MTGLKVGIAVSVIVVVGMVMSLMWGLLANKKPPPPELKQLDWWENTIIYQIYPRSLKDSDGDGIGDLKGIISKLDYFVEAGVGTIWMSPIFVSPMVDIGYDITDFYNIQKEYGTMADFEELVDKAHKLGIKVLLDYVPNHASTESEYFKRSEAKEPGYENYFVWADPVTDPNNASNRLVPSNWISEFGGSTWEWNEVRKQYFYHQFSSRQADFNYREPAVRREMLNIMRYWLEKGVDGYRLDAVPHIFEVNPDDYGGVYPDESLEENMVCLRSDHIKYTVHVHTRDLIEIYDVIYEWREFADKWKLDNNAETKILLAEVYALINLTMLYYGNEKDKDGAHFPFNFDLITSLSSSSDARDFAYVIQRWLTYMPKGRIANWVFGNHDRTRVPTRFRPNMIDGLNALSMILPGVAITYQGEEIGMKDGYVSWEDTVDVSACNQGNPHNYLEFSRDPSRTPFHWDNSTSAGFSTNKTTWLPVGLDYMELNLQAQREAKKSHFKVYRSMTKLRKEPSLSHGEYFIEALTQYTLIVLRHLRTFDTYALIFNVGEQDDVVDLTAVSLLKEPITVYVSSVHSSRSTGDNVPRGPIALRAGEALVLQGSPV